MKRNYVVLKGQENTREYIKLDGKSNVLVTPVHYDDKTIFQIKEILYLDTLPITISYYANKLGKSITDIENSYFDFKDPKEVFNAMGRIKYEMSLLSRIKDSLERKKYDQENTQMTR